MKICCISDIHGNLNFDIPKCDLLLIAGDICPADHNPFISVNSQSDFLAEDFKYWLTEQPCKEVVGIAGNHDWIFEVAKDKVPELNVNWHYLEDSFIEIQGEKIYGSPWQLPFNDWAFNLEEPQLSRKWIFIPEDTDILLVHSSIFEIGDKVQHENSVENIGSKSLREKIIQIKPGLVVFGHNHDGHGEYELEGVRCINASLLDDNYRMSYSPIMVEI